VNYFEDNSLAIGNTPMIQLKRLIEDNGGLVLGKIEGRNPAYSVKCRIGASMVWDAEKRGVLKPGVEIIEPTSGNTGIALAYVGAARGYKVNIVMPHSMSIERRKIMSAFGAEVILTEGAEGMTGAIDKAQEIVDSDPDKYFMPQQFRNPANPAIHEKTTGPEIWRDTDGKVDVLVSSVGTGGTISGVSRYIKQEMKRDIVSVAVEPASSPVISQILAGEPLTPKDHVIQGIGAGFVPDTLDLSVVDRVERIENHEALEYTQRLSVDEGILCGISCGAAVAAAARLVKEPVFEGKTIVVILPDSGERYCSMMPFDALL